MQQNGLSGSSLNYSGEYQRTSIRVKLVMGLAGKASEALEKLVEGIAGGLLQRFLC